MRNASSLVSKGFASHNPSIRGLDSNNDIEKQRHLSSEHHNAFLGLQRSCTPDFEIDSSYHEHQHFLAID